MPSVSYSIATVGPTTPPNLASIEGIDVVMKLCTGQGFDGSFIPELVAEAMKKRVEFLASGKIEGLA